MWPSSSPYSAVINSWEYPVISIHANSDRARKTAPKWRVYRSFRGYPMREEGQKPGWISRNPIQVKTVLCFSNTFLGFAITIFVISVVDLIFLVTFENWILKKVFSKTWGGVQGSKTRKWFSGNAFLQVCSPYRPYYRYIVISWKYRGAKSGLNAPRPLTEMCFKKDH